MNAAWKVQCEPSQKLVLLALADHANDETWKCWPSLGHLHKKTGLNRRTVSRCIQSLVEQKLIGRINRGRESTVYQLNVANWGQYAPSGNTPLAAESHQGRGDTPLGVGASCPKGRGVTPHEPSDNHQLEPSGNRKADRFDEFWQAYPSKKAKKPTEDKWKRKGLDAKADEIIADVLARKERDRQWLDGYIPNPSTYLSQERWNDEWQAVEQKQKPREVSLDDASPI